MADDLGRVTDRLVLPWKPRPAFPSDASHSQQVGCEPGRQVLLRGCPRLRSGCLGPLEVQARSRPCWAIIPHVARATEAKKRPNPILLFNFWGP